MSVSRIEKKTLGIRELALALGVTVVKPDDFKDDYIVTKGEERQVTTRKKLRATVCEVGGDPMEDD